MVDEAAASAEQLPLEGAGQKLKRAREAAGLTLDQVSAETRINLRHLGMIEDGRFADLPAKTYAVGFSRTYARMVGLDEYKIADEVRAELSESDRYSERPSKFEPGDPGKVPSRALAWFGVFAALILVAGVFAFYRSFFAPGMGPAPLTEDPAPAQANADGATNGSGATPAAGQQAAAPTGGNVVFTSLEDGMWVRFYDGTENKVLLEKLMGKGERFTVPSDATAPKIRTGRPDAFAVTIGGKKVAKLAEDDFVMSDVPIDAQSLLARSDVGTGAQPALN